MRDPPASSYPSCIAVKSAGLQSAELGIVYFHRVREACMINGQNIARHSVLFDVAKQLAVDHPGFDLDKFKDDYTGDAGMDAFRADLDEVRKFNINRFPTLIIRSVSKGILIAGHRHPAQVLDAIEQLKSA
jgi:predicted DsbA family dithiol-disulfide isomerase